MCFRRKLFASAIRVLSSAEDEARQEPWLSKSWQSGSSKDGLWYGSISHQGLTIQGCTEPAEQMIAVVVVVVVVVVVASAGGAYVRSVSCWVP